MGQTCVFVFYIKCLCNCSDISLRAMIFQYILYITWILEAYICKYNRNVGVLCYRCMLRTSNHAGLEGYIIKNIRNQVEFSIQVRGKKRSLTTYVKLWMNLKVIPHPAQRTCSQVIPVHGSWEKDWCPCWGWCCVCHKALTRICSTIWTGEENS